MRNPNIFFDKAVAARDASRFVREGRVVVLHCSMFEAQRRRGFSRKRGNRDAGTGDEEWCATENVFPICMCVLRKKAFSIDRATPRYGIAAMLNAHAHQVVKHA